MLTCLRELLHEYDASPLVQPAEADGHLGPAGAGRQQPRVPHRGRQAHPREAQADAHTAAADAAGPLHPPARQAVSSRHLSSSGGRSGAPPPDTTRPLAEAWSQVWPRSLVFRGALRVRGLLASFVFRSGESVYALWKWNNKIGGVVGGDAERRSNYLEVVFGCWCCFSLCFWGLLSVKL